MQETKEGLCWLVIELAHVQAVTGWVALGEVVRKAELIGAPDQLEVAQLDPVSYPVVAHVDGSRALLQAGIVGQSDRSSVVAGDWGGFLRVTHVDCSLAQGGSVSEQDECPSILSLCGRSNDCG